MHEMMEGCSEIDVVPGVAPDEDDAERSHNARMAEARAATRAALAAKDHSVEDYSRFDGIGDQESATIEIERVRAPKEAPAPIKVTLTLEAQGKQGKFTLTAPWLRRTVGDLARVFYRKHAGKVAAGLELTVARLELERGMYVAKRTQLSILADIGDALRAGDVLAVATREARARGKAGLPPLPGPEPDDFEALTVLVHVGEAEARDAAFLGRLRGELVGPSGTTTMAYVDDGDDALPPFVAVACRPGEVGRHVLTVYDGDAVLDVVDRDVVAPEPAPRDWAELSPKARGALVGWIAACDEACTVDREDAVTLPLAPATAPKKKKVVLMPYAVLAPCPVCTAMCGR